MTTRIACMVGFFWLAAATAVTRSGWLGLLPMPFPQVVLAALTGALLLAFARVPSFRRWVLALDARALLAVHLTRFVGLYFIFLHFRSELPYAFAVPAGVGDTAVASLAVAVAFIAPRPRAGSWSRWLWLAWNTAGLADIGFVVWTAARLGMENPASMTALTTFPLGLLPTFLVPLIIASHIALFVRLAGTASDRNRSSPVFAESPQVLEGSP